MAAKTATAAFDDTVRTSDRRDGAGCSPSPQLWWGARGRTSVCLRVQKKANADPAEYLKLWGAAGALLEPRPQGRIQRHTVEYIIDVSLFVQILDVLVPQMGNQLVEVLKMHDTVSMLSQCPRSLDHPVLFARFSVSRRWRSSWWKCQRMCLSPRSSSSRTLTFQFPEFVVSLALEAFKVFTQDEVRCSALLNRSLTFQFPWRSSQFSP